MVLTVFSGGVLKMLGRGALLGLGAALPIGPVNVEIARRTLRSGFHAGFALGCGAVTVDVVYAMVTGASMAPVLKNTFVLTATGVVGGLFLALLGILSIRAAIHQKPIAVSGASVPPARMSLKSHYLTGLAMTSLNPMTLIFWFVAVPGTVGEITRNPHRDLPLVAVGVLTGTLAWVSSFAGVMALAHAAGGNGARSGGLRAADLAGGLVLLGFAGYTIWRVAGGFLS